MVLPNREKNALECDFNFDIEYYNYSGDIDEITFYGQLNEPIHRWFRLTAAFSPELVRKCIRWLELDADDKILDPYCGTGTTIVESMFQGHDAVGVEYNPVYQQVAGTKSTWFTTHTEVLRDLKRQIHTNYHQLKREWRKKSIDQLADEGIYIPNIYNRQRWWHDYVLKDLTALRETIEQLSATSEQKRFFRVGLMAILIDASNATYQHVSLSYMDEPPEDVDAFYLFINKIDQMITDFDVNIESDNNPESEVIAGDSTQLSAYLPNNSVDAIITSPPYPNRYSYIRETRPHMFFFDLVEDSNDVGNLALDSIGGTWGRATSHLKDADIEYENEAVENAIGDAADELTQEDEQMRNYVVKYFNKMEQHFQGVENVLKPGGKMSYTVGNSTIKGIHIPTDEYLAKMFHEHGFTNIKIVRARERNSGTELYEAIVEAEIQE